MDFRDKAGAPLIKWSDPEGAFEAWKECSRGRPCDYTGMSYAKLTGGSGVRWPRNDQFPDGAERLYTDGRFPTDAGSCSSYGLDLVTGAATSPEDYKAHDPGGRAWIKAAEYTPPPESPDEDYPFWLTTGRVVYHFHTRTKTGRTQELNAAAPDVFVEIAAGDAETLGISEGDLVEVESRRGTLRAPARVAEILAGHLFVPFHYGYWDDPDTPRAANEVTLSEWDPASKQPTYKFAAVRVRKTTALTAAADAVGAGAAGVRAVVHKVEGAMEVLRSPATGPHVGRYLGLVHEAERQMADSLKDAGKHHAEEPDMTFLCDLLATWSERHVEQLAPFADRYSGTAEGEPKKLRRVLFQGPRSGGFGLLRDLQDLWLMAHEVHVGWEVLRQAARGLRDQEFISFCERCEAEADMQINWLRTRIDQSATQALIVPS